MALFSSYCGCVWYNTSVDSSHVCIVAVVCGCVLVAVFVCRQGEVGGGEGVRECLVVTLSGLLAEGRCRR